MGRGGRSGSWLRACEPARIVLFSGIGVCLLMIANVASAAPVNSWTEVPTPAGRTMGGLSDASCWAPGRCMAVGGSQIDQSTGSTWSSEDVGSEGRSTFHAVACPSPSFCIAVGTTPTKSPAVAEWNGADWSRGLGPSASGSLSDVSCSSPTSCIAIGASQNSRVLTELRNGPKGTVEPPPPGNGVSLSSVSCAPNSAPTTCTAIGWSPSSEAPIAAVWRNGWSSLPTPPTVADGTLLNGISCVAPTDCFAAGSYFETIGPPGGELVEHWDAALEPDHIDI